MAVVLLVLSLAACSNDGAAGDTTTSTPQAAMVVTSPAFADGDLIPEQYTCNGDDTSPPLTLTNIPDGTVSLALLVIDPEAMSAPWDHWIVYDIAPRDTIPEGVQNLGTVGTNTWGRTDYGGPCPDLGVHPYTFTVLALDTELGLAPGATKDELLAAVDGHVLAQATLNGRYG
jgi:Raf kinase inhibitor-like YbhB/YbcL family protein